jgi:cobaltochelatase CobN
MFVDPLAWSLAEVDILRGNTSRERIEGNPHLFEEHYREPALRYIQDVVRGGSPAILPGEIVARAETLRDRHGAEAPDNIMDIMMSMGMQSRDSAKSTEALSRDTLLAYLGRISADEQLRTWFLKLEDGQAFEKTSSMLDSLTYSKVKKLAKMVPAMRAGLEQFDKPHVRDVIAHMVAVRDTGAVFAMLKSDSVLARAKAVRDNEREEMLAYYCDRARIDALSRWGSGEMDARDIASTDADTVRRWHATIAGALDRPQDFWENGRLPVAVRRIMGSRDSRERIQNAKAVLEQALERIESDEKRFVAAVETVEGVESAIRRAMDGLRNSARYELDALVNALNGGHIAPSSGGDAVHNPSAVPTGRNLYGIDAESAPGKAAWDAGVKMAESVLAKLKRKNGAWPRKVAFTLWGGEFIRDQGATVAQILYLLGAEPVGNSVGRIYDVRLVPEERLGRPRIDVLVQTSGQFRDIAATRLYLIDKAVKLAAEAKGTEHENFVAVSTRDAERVLKEKGLSPAEARDLSTARVFGGIDGNYGTGIMGLVESGDRYDSDTVIANQYLKNMGAVYTEDRWGSYTPGLLEAAVQNTDAVMHSRTSNVSGPLSLDHVYEFMGGLNTVIKKVTGRDPDGMFLDMRNKYHAQAVDAKEAVWTEARSTILNPRFIEPLTRGGASSAETFAEITRNTFAWNVTKESVIDKELWDRYHETLIRDTLNLGLREFFESKNPYALQEITAVMLETVRKGMWSPDSAVIRELADIHVDLVNRHSAGCSGFVCDNAKLRAMIAATADAAAAKEYSRSIRQVRETSGAGRDAVVLKKEKLLDTVMDLVRNNMIAVMLVGALAALIVASWVFTRINNTRKNTGGE